MIVRVYAGGVLLGEVTKPMMVIMVTIGVWLPPVPSAGIYQSMAFIVPTNSTYFALL